MRSTVRSFLNNRQGRVLVSRMGPFRLGTRTKVWDWYDGSIQVPLFAGRAQSAGVHFYGELLSKIKVLSSESKYSQYFLLEGVVLPTYEIEWLRDGSFAKYNPFSLKRPEFPPHHQMHNNAIHKVSHQNATSAVFAKWISALNDGVVWNGVRGKCLKWCRKW